jgi:hypothetical protein
MTQAYLLQKEIKLIYHSECRPTDLYSNPKIKIQRTLRDFFTKKSKFSVVIKKSFR